MEKQYLLVAEQISFRNNRLTIINVWDQFTAIHSPAKFNFDMAFICGPGWQAGEYELKFKVRSSASEIFELGSIKANITNDKSVFNAIATNVNFMVAQNSGNISFIIERDGEEIFEREYPVLYLFDLKKEEGQENTEQAENQESTPV